jgi:hypothetical protein
MYRWVVSVTRQRCDMARLRVGIVFGHGPDMAATPATIVVHVGLFAGFSKPLDLL